MRVEIKQGGDGVACWNAEAIAAYAAAADAREAALAAANPDLVVTPGLVKCYGCETLEFDMGFGCTGKLTRTLYAVTGEVAPAAPATTAAPAAPAPSRAPVPPSAAPRRSGLKGLLGRRG